MKINTASVRSKNWCTEQMICIYQHCSKHNEISLFPVFPKKDVGQNQWKTKVQKIVDDWSYIIHLYSPFKIIFSYFFFQFLNRIAETSSGHFFVMHIKKV